MEDKLRDKLRLMLGIKLAMLPRWVKHDFWRQAEPQNGRAKEKMVDEIIAVIDETVEVGEKE
jgi:hypothetical protein